MAIEQIVTLSDEPGDSVKLSFHVELLSCNIYIPGGVLAAVLFVREDGRFCVRTVDNQTLEMEAVIAAGKFILKTLQSVDRPIARGVKITW